MTTPAGIVAPMTPERWRAVDAIIQMALACDPAERDVFVREACDGDEALHAEVLSLLAAGDGTGEFLEHPAAELLLEPGGAAAERLARALAGRYEIQREVARGGMATVHLARDLRHDRMVALKVLRAEMAAAVGAERFLEEIRLTASLQHPNILPLFDSGTADGLPWYATPYVAGDTLRAHLAQRGSLPVDEAVRLAREIAAALDHAHARGIVHRDVKPENVLLRDGHAVVADFGIALALQQAGGDRLTRTGLALGTPQYMAPEQAAGQRDLDARVDVYALGAVLHEMLAGESPFAAASRQAVVQRVMNEPPTALAARRPDVAPAIADAIRRALAKQPAERFPDAASFAAALGDTRPTPQVMALPEPGRRRVSARAAIYACAAAFAVGAALGVVVTRWPLLKHVPDAGTVAAGAAAPADITLMLVDRTGRALRGIPADRPWTPRFSPDGKRLAYGAFGPGRQSSDIWVLDLTAGTTRRVTNDDRDANDPQWSPDGVRLAWSAGSQGEKDVVIGTLGAGDARIVAARPGSQFPTDWLRDGRGLLVTEEAGNNQHDILVQPADGSKARPYLATQADESAARMSPDGRWIAYTSTVSGRPEVYVDSYPVGGHRVMLSTGGGAQPAWRGDGRELYYWRDGTLVAVSLGAPAGAAPPSPGAETELFRAPYDPGVIAMYDVSPDGQRFVFVRRR